MLDRLFGEGGFGGIGIGIVILFFIFLAFSDCWVDIDICAWIPFLILLLIVCGAGDMMGGECC